MTTPLAENDIPTHNGSIDQNCPEDRDASITGDGAEGINDQEGTVKQKGVGVEGVAVTNSDLGDEKRDILKENGIAREEPEQPGDDAGEVARRHGNDRSVGEGDASAETISRSGHPDEVRGPSGLEKPVTEPVVLAIAVDPAKEGNAEPFDPTDGLPNPEDFDQPDTTLSPAPSNPLLRPPTPSSRTSTPPLSASSNLAPRKFSSINVNKKFLSKTASPAAVASPTSAKLGSLSGEYALDGSGDVTHKTLGRPAASPVPISSASSRLLSTKLTTVPSSKSSISPNPPSSAGAPGNVSSSPWAKPAAPITIETPADSQTLHQPTPRQVRTLTSTIPAAMGSGLGIGTSAPRPAWRQVPAEGRLAPGGISRDFPTTNEIAEGEHALLSPITAN